MTPAAREPNGRKLLGKAEKKKRKEREREGIDTIKERE